MSVEKKGITTSQTEKIRIHLFSILIPHLKFQNPTSLQNVSNERTDERAKRNIP